jgi:penicillin-binding protein A
MNRAIGRIFLVGVVLFVALIANVTYVQVFAAKGLADRPENHRSIAEDLRIRRGAILGFDGKTIAGSKKQSGFWYRTYPLGGVAPQIVGYNSVRFGRSGLESSMNDYLTGADSGNDWQAVVDDALGRRKRGNDVTLTIVPSVQKAAQAALGTSRGAVVVMDPDTGAIIAAASSPSYDPATLEDDWRRLSKDPAAPLFSRTTQGLYPPGSSFKVVTAAAALESGNVTPTTPFDDTGTYAVGGGEVTNYHGEVFGGNTFTEALTKSINTTFGKVGTLLGKQTLVDDMTRFGFYQVPPLQLPAGQVKASGRYGPKGLLSVTAPMDQLALAWMAVGQESLLATPLQMALVTSAVANGGEIPAPYLVQQVTNPDGETVYQAQPETWKIAMDATTAQTLNTMMQQVVNAGTGTRAALSGIQVAGKTGTAEKGDGSNVAWFIGFAPADAPQVVVAVTIESTSATGGDVAAPIAAEMMRLALAQPTLP